MENDGERGRDIQINQPNKLYEGSNSRTKVKEVAFFRGGGRERWSTKMPLPLRYLFDCRRDFFIWKKSTLV